MVESEIQQESPPLALVVASSAQHITSRRRKRPVDQSPLRHLSCVVRGRLHLVASLFKEEVLPCGRLVAQEWPQHITAPRKLSTPSARHQRERQRAGKYQARVRARTRA